MRKTNCFFFFPMFLTETGDNLFCEHNKLTNLPPKTSGTGKVSVGRSISATCSFTNFKKLSDVVKVIVLRRVGLFSFDFCWKSCGQASSPRPTNLRGIGNLTKKLSQNSVRTFFFTVTVESSQTNLLRRKGRIHCAQP